jgi:phosphoribosyl 1,2-cyclic phosphodiesterase
MKIKFYGTRGSISVSGKEFVEFGGDTSCVAVWFDSGRIAVFDAGTGIRRLGNDLIDREHGQRDNMFIILSHTHWDHIQGFPFFKPAYDQGRQLTLAIPGWCDQGRPLEDIIAAQMQNDFFPVPLAKMGAKIRFWQPDLESYTSPFGVTITASQHPHPGCASTYRVTEGDKVLVYCTDVEHGDRIDPGVVEISRGADLLIHDAQYTPEELPRKRGWGHSSWEQAAEVAERAGVKRLALFHHDPEHDDEFILGIEKKCRDRFPESFAAREGMEVEL